jgi:RNA polymerase sigma-70 factor (ECF subfamily)
MWDEIYQRHYPELVRYAASVCKDLQQAEDVAQEVFLKALQSADVFEDLSDAQQRAWLYRALKNYMIDCFRRAKLESEYLDMIPEEAAYDDSRIQETENQLLLATLAPQDRMLFHLRYEEGYNASELSEMLGLPPGTIRARLSRCRMILKKQLSNI